MILAIDSASVSASAALVSGDGQLVAQSFQNTGLTHSQTLLPLIEDLMKNARQPLAALSTIAVTNGPGSFTGLRIGVATALGLREALGIPCSGVSSLRAAAASALPYAGRIAAVMDARRDQLYTAAFTSDGAALIRECDDRAISREELFAELGDTAVCWTGDAADFCHGAKGGFLPPAPLPMAHGAALCLLDGETRPPEEICYLRHPQAERERLQNS